MHHSHSESIKFYKRLSYKITAMVLLLLVLSVAAIGYYGYKNASEAYMDHGFHDSEERVEKIAAVLESEFQQSLDDVSFMSEFYSLKRYIEWSSLSHEDEMQKWYEVTADTFKAFLLSKKRYMQVRYIDNNGDEKIRLDYDASKHQIDVMPKEKLQNKAERDYFIQTMALLKGMYYVSHFNLNREQKKVEIPYKPTIRFSTPVINKNGERCGILITNLLGNKLLDKIREHDTHLHDEGRYMLVNKEGDYLYHRDEKMQFGFDKGRRERVGKLYPRLFEASKKDEMGTIIENGHILSYRRIYPSGTDDKNYVVVISEIAHSHALAALENFKLTFLLLSFAVFMSSVYIIRRINIALSPLESVSLQLHQLAQGELPKEILVVDSDDEVGMIVESTNLVMNNIRSTVNHAGAIAKGDFSKELVVYSDKDKLNSTLNRMTRRLSSVAEIADAISSGDYSHEMEEASPNDALARSLNNMVGYLREVRDMTVAISMGDLRHDFVLHGDKDKLGMAMNHMLGNLREIVEQAHHVADGEFGFDVEPKGNNDELSSALSRMKEVLAENMMQIEKEMFIKDCISGLNSALSGNKSQLDVAEEAIVQVCRYINASSGVCYLNRDDKLYIGGTYAFVELPSLPKTFEFSEGVIGQVAAERKPILLDTVSDGEYLVRSALFSSAPAVTYTNALVHKDMLVGVMEVASLKPFSEDEIALLDKAADVVALYLLSASQNEKILELLDKSKRDYEELQMQSEELQQTNVQIEEQSQQLQMKTQEMKKKNEELFLAKENLDRQAKELIQTGIHKSEFLANMSHELRTPLNSIILLSEMLSNALKVEKNRKKAEVIHSAGHDLLGLINEILDFSKIEAGHMDVHLTEMTSGEIADALSNLFEPIAKDKGLEFIIKNEIDTSFRSDQKKVMQVLKNLISNALKFTKKGSVTVRMYKNAEQLYFTVTDTGMGIAKEQQENIFNPFRQGDGSITREYGGTGLGLSISRRFANMLGGFLEVESAEGKGAVFRMCIPQNSAGNEKIVDTLNKTESPAAVPILEEGQETVDFETTFFKAKTVLIVDDDSRNIFALSALYEDLGAHTLHALNGKEALDIIGNENEKIDLILMDIMMPKMGGYEAIKNIRKNARYAKIPIIAVTAKAMEKDKQKCMEAGADDYVTKPINKEALLQLSCLWIEKMA